MVDVAVVAIVVGVSWHSVGDSGDLEDLFGKTC
jgi:hypothetical protein